MKKLRKMVFFDKKMENYFPKKRTKDNKKCLILTELIYVYHLRKQIDD